MGTSGLVVPACLICQKGRVLTNWMLHLGVAFPNFYWLISAWFYVTLVLTAIGMVAALLAIWAAWGADSVVISRAERARRRREVKP